MIDEGFGCLDDKNLPKVVEALSVLALQKTHGSVQPIVIAVTHREDMNPYFTERLNISVIEPGDGVTEITSSVTYPPDAKSNLDSINLHVAHSAPPKMCDVCKCEVASSAWLKHLKSAKHKENIGGSTTTVTVSDTECKLCNCVIKAGKLERHNNTKAHITKKQNQEALIDILKTDTYAASNGSTKVRCTKCKNGSEYSAKQWVKHIKTKKHNSS
jgi:hypothetical protein